jgi:hypothetical protein
MYNFHFINEKKIIKTLSLNFLNLTSIVKSGYNFYLPSRNHQFKSDYSYFYYKLFN